MQQFATTQTSIAANKVPFEDVKLSSSVPRDANNSTFDNSSRKSAFEEALAKQEQSSQSNNKGANNDNASQRADSIARNDAAKQARQQSVDRANEQQDARQRKQAQTEQLDDTRERQRSEQAEQAREQAQSQKAQTKATDAKAAEKAAENTVQTNSTSAEQAKNNAANKSSSEDKNTEFADDIARAGDKNMETHCEDCDSHSESTDAEANARSSHESLASQNTGKEQALDAQSITDDFDWVAYVNQVKDLSASSDIIPNDMHVEETNTALDIFAQTIASLNGEDDNAKVAEAVNVDILDEVADKEFLEIKLSEEELATLINAAGGNSEEQLALNSDAMAELDNAIAKLLNQLVSASDAEPTQNTEEAAIDVEKDSDLLKDFLQASAIEIEDPQKVPMPLEATNEKPLTDNTHEDEQKIPLPLETNVDELDFLSAEEALEEPIKNSENTFSDTDVSTVKNDQYLVPKPLESGQDNDVVLAEVEAELMAASAAPSAKVSPDKVDKAADAPLFVPLDKVSAKKQTELLAKLPPEAENSAIENIAARVESVISDVKADGKSTEFIAALQSGVKEMKEQLKQGREPGIDLKALVSEALTEADVKVPASKEAALDKQLNQVSNILAAATSLGQSNQQQNYLNTGLNEVQGMKEIGQQQIESTRLAQQTVVSEKAVNIFKPEGQQQLSEKVRWMVNSRNLSAEIRLDPPDLGGMNIKVNLSGDSASVSFVVQSQQAREALDQAVPRLREMLEEQGIELGQSSVEQDSSGGNQQSDEGSLANNSNASSNLAQQSQDTSHNGQQSADEQAQIDDDGFIEQRINGGRIGGIDYYA